MLKPNKYPMIVLILELRVWALGIKPVLVNTNHAIG